MTEQEIDKSRAQGTYLSLLDDVDAHLKDGNLPAAEQGMGRIGKIAKDGLLSPDCDPLPQDALAAFTRRFETKKDRYSIHRTVFDSQLRQGNTEAARRTLDGIRNRFPAHPDISELEQQVGADVLAES